MSFSRYPQIQDYVCLKFPTDQVQQHAHDLIHASLSSFIQEMEINGHSTWNPPTILLGECNSFLTYHRLPSFLCFSKKNCFAYSQMGEIETTSRFVWQSVKVPGKVTGIY